MNKKQQIQEFILSQIQAHPEDLVRLVANHFKMTVQGAQKHITRLISQGQINKTGNTRNSRYTLAEPLSAAESAAPSFPSSSVTAKPGAFAFATWTYPVHEALSEQDVWNDHLKARLKDIPKNIRDIAEYGFTEMVNNVKDHSEANQLIVTYQIAESILHISVEDNGIGIYQKLQSVLRLESPHDAVLDLSKGKLTTDHARHSGEGIYFSSRVFDKFFIVANGHRYGRINTSIDEDWISGEEKSAGPGTRVDMQIALNSHRTRDEVFRNFTSPEDFSFNKTHVAVELGMVQGETYVSRSQAKRILFGLEKFKFIDLNFKRVNSVGQGFVDEVFRVFKLAHPEIEITYTNANEAIEFMIRRCR